MPETAVVHVRFKPRRRTNHEPPRPAHVNPHDLTWWKASYSSENGACIEVAHVPEGWVAVRDSKDLDQGLTLVAGTAWSTFIASVNTGAI